MCGFATRSGSRTQVLEGLARKGKNARNNQYCATLSHRKKQGEKIFHRDL